MIKWNRAGWCWTLALVCLLMWPCASARGQDELNELLEVFRAEFIDVTPGTGMFPQDAFLQESGSKTLENADARRARMTDPLAVSKYEIPQNLWEAVMGSNPSRWQGPRNSVEELSFDEAVAFCREVTTKMRDAGLIDARQLVRLPTETEWEYFARAGTESVYSFGDDVAQIDDFAWSTQNASGNDPPVGAKKPNAWDLYDIHGYLWEWCISDVEDPDRELDVNREQWSAAVDGDRAALRGGSWKDAAELLTSGYRRLADRTMRDDAVGLRCVLVTIKSSVADQFQPTAQDSIVPAQAELQLVWNDGEFTEGPALAPDGSIVFSDIGDRIMRYDPRSGEVSTFREPSGRANGLMFDARGRLIACEGANTGGARRVSMTRADDTVTTFADSYQQNRFNSPNDLAIAPDGAIYFTDPRYVGDEVRELDFDGVFRISPRGAVSLATDGLTKPNGIVISADGKTAYVSEHHPTGDKHLVRFAINDAGQFVQPNVLFDFGAGRGIDGMTTDRDGRIYATAGAEDQAGIYVFGPQGEHLALIKLPGAPTNCCFGGGDYASTLFITAAGPEPDGPDTPRRYGLYKIVLKTSGSHVVRLNQ